MRPIRIIGAPVDLGASRRGVDMGPSAMRICQLGEKLQALGYKVSDIGNIIVPIAESIDQGNPKCKYKKEILSACRELKKQVKNSLTEGYTPLVLGGDHSIAMGSTAGVSEYYAENDQKVGLIWFDAHGDINLPETSPSGNIHGMPVAHILGLGDSDLKSLSHFSPMLDKKNLVMIGLRDLDLGEKELLKKLEIKVFTMSDIDKGNLSAIMNEAIEVASSGTAGFHVSFDMDWLDPSVAPGVGTAVSGGATYRESHLVMECLAESKSMLSLEITEVNPILDYANRTAQCAVELILSAFGKNIL